MVGAGETLDRRVQRQREDEPGVNVVHESERAHKADVLVPVLEVLRGRVSDADGVANKDGVHVGETRVVVEGGGVEGKHLRVV